mmetsp:Transcript_15486/g.35401  ORF Transcript_15486/g.35401 Transcript_15486/m.35401 type:complete len:365 (-) Transcript_15486:9-1103(-)
MDHAVIGRIDEAGLRAAGGTQGSMRTGTQSSSVVERTPSASIASSRRHISPSFIVVSVENPRPSGRLLCAPLMTLQRLLRRPAVRAAVQYRFELRALLMLSIVAAAAWFAHYIIVLRPQIDKYEGRLCDDVARRLVGEARHLLLYFTWFVWTRFALFVPIIVISLACLQHQVARLGMRIQYLICFVVRFTLRDGPLYMFLIASVWFAMRVMQPTLCKDSPQLTSALHHHAGYSCALGIVWSVLCWSHSATLQSIFVAVSDELLDVPHSALELVPEASRGAPPHTIASLETLTYDPARFGDAEDKQYPGECAICLLPWANEDCIKKTRCAHTFHEECLSKWFTGARTCPVCRVDVSGGTTEGIPC